MRYKTTDEEVLTVAETADLLKLSEYTVRELARKGELPGRKVGRAWRFVRGAVMDLVRMVPPGERPPAGYDNEPLTPEEIVELDRARVAYESGEDQGVTLGEYMGELETKRTRKPQSSRVGRRR
ncbi:MAG: helix-turn-helix domain-containing protein [Bacillota bacterium]|nr:helix-turn-helix domain-containing protein [Bacillota bacterium]